MKSHLAAFDAVGPPRVAKMLHLILGSNKVNLIFCAMAGLPYYPFSFARPRLGYSLRLYTSASDISR
jgi:hypothetical protein